MLLGAPENNKSKKAEGFKAVCHCTFVSLSFFTPRVILCLSISPTSSVEWICAYPHRSIVWVVWKLRQTVIQIEVCPVSDNTKTNLFFCLYSTTFDKASSRDLYLHPYCLPTVCQFFCFATDEKKYLTSTLEEVLSAEVFFFLDVIKSCLKPCPTFSVESPDGFAACTTDFIHWCFSKCQQGVVFQN